MKAMLRPGTGASFLSFSFSEIESVQGQNPGWLFDDGFAVMVLLWVVSAPGNGGNRPGVRSTGEKGAGAAAFQSERYHLQRRAF